METRWVISVKSNEAKSWWEVEIGGYDEVGHGSGNTPHEAYANACQKLLLVPWLANPITQPKTEA